MIAEALLSLTRTAHRERLAFRFVAVCCLLSTGAVAVPPRPICAMPAATWPCVGSSVGAGGPATARTMCPASPRMAASLAIFLTRELRLPRERAVSATTVQVAIADDAQPQDLCRPGHINPLRARPGGVLVRTGQTEGSVDLCRMAGLRPAAARPMILTRCSRTTSRSAAV